MTHRTTFRMHIPCVIVLTGLLAFARPDLGNAAEQAATVLSVSPSVASHEGGKVTTLEVKMKVPVAATVISDAAGRAQLMFPDTTTVSIAPGTEIALAEFVDDPNEESIILNMAQGTARFITGEVSRRKPSAMVVNTPQASIGIRGTMVTVVVSGDTTKVYLTETSGLGVTVTDRNSGEQKKMVKPGNIISITPRGMEERQGSLEEVRRMTVDLHTAPRLTDDERRVPVAVASITPAGTLGATGGFDSVQNMPELTNTGLDISLINGHYAGSGTNNTTMRFDVNAYATITNAAFQYGTTAHGTGGSGQIYSNGSFAVNNWPADRVSGFDTVSMTGQFASPTNGLWNLNATNNGTPYSASGTFSK